MKYFKNYLWIALCVVFIGCNEDDSNDAVCNSPTSLDVINITGTSAILLWSDGSQNVATFTIEYGEVGFELGTGTTLTTSNESIELQGLSPGVIYQFYVKANCANGAESSFAAPRSFTTVDEPFCQQVQNFQLVFT
ncbi:MAG: fibronectin type III domain-containing protein [Bacteroidota bacterium]